MQDKNAFTLFTVALAIFSVAVFVTGASAAVHETVLYSFGSGTDAAYPEAGLVFDAHGNLYGTTYSGGAHGKGTVFELSPGNGGWTETVLHSFPHDSSDGYYPYASLIVDVVGNLYGTTTRGGAYGYGMVFELSPGSGGSWTETVLHNFAYNGADGIYPFAGLIFDAAGNLYGTTYGGGPHGHGTVFELSPGSGGWTEAVLHSFNNNGSDGYDPDASLVFDGDGNLYGTTYSGGALGKGTVFELSSGHGGWTETVLHSFPHDSTDGYNPFAGLIVDGAGNLYGTTVYGGSTGNWGTVFELSPGGSGGSWTETVLQNFDFVLGAQPYAGLTFDQFGHLYGTTYGVGTFPGVVFELVSDWEWGWLFNELYGFNNGSGMYPRGSLVFDRNGNLYGTTVGGGTYGHGTVFEVSP